MDFLTDSPELARYRVDRPGPAARTRPLAIGRCAAGLALVLAASLPAAPAVAGDTTPARTLERFTAEAGAPAQAERGRRFFAERHGGEWSCASCHGTVPTAGGRHASTGKAIDPLAPSRNASAFTDTARTDKWFRRNCRDVLRRECTAAEKADVLAWLLSLRP